MSLKVSAINTLTQLAFPGAVGDDPTTGSAVNDAMAGLADQLWLVIPGGLVVWGIIYGLGRTKKAAKTAIS